MIPTHDTCGNLVNHCYNKKCYNFTSNQELNGRWCCDECVIESESEEPRLTRKELLQIKVKYDWDLDIHEKKQVQEMKIKEGLI